MDHKSSSQYRITRQLSVCAAIISLAGLATGAPKDHANKGKHPNYAPRAARIMDLDLGFTRGRVRLDRADAPASIGRREYKRFSAVDRRLAAALGPNAECVITSRVIVQLDRGARPASVLKGFDFNGAEPKRLPGRGNFWIVDLASIEQAARVSEILSATKGVRRAHLDAQQPRALRSLPTDPLVADQWHLHNTLNPGVDLNVQPAWDAGFTGAGIDVGIVEGGWQLDHPDLTANHNQTVSMPVEFASTHATSVAGLVGAVAGNEIGGVGVAYNARISAQVYGSASEDAAALLHANDIIDVKNNSWGPLDSGAFWTLAPVQTQAIADAAQLGRGGLGTVLVWAAGNGTRADRVEFDPWASSRFTLSVGGIDEGDDRAVYSEPGSALHVVAPSSGDGRSIVTTAAGDNYSFDFGATSAATPQVSGVVALMLQANPALTYRDVQQIIIDTARTNDPASPDWRTNASGRDIHYDYGFGAVDAAAAVSAAQTWVNLPQEVSHSTPEVSVNAEPPGGSATGISRTVTVEAGIQLEHVELVLDCDIDRPEDLTITLLSPDGTESVLAKGRFASRIRPSDPDLDHYVLTSARHWGESTDGVWTVTVADLLADEPTLWKSFQLNFYGVPATAPCAADFDSSGEVDGADISAFLDKWFIADSSADMTTTSSNPGDAGFGQPDGAVNGADLSWWIEQWVIGCD